VVTRRRHVGSDEQETAQRESAVPGVRLPSGAAAMLALQRQAGNVAVARMLGAGTSKMPGSWEEDETPESSRAPSPAAAPELPSLGGQPETEVPLAAIPRPPSPAPSAASSAPEVEDEFFDALDGSEGAPPIQRPGSRASGSSGGSGDTEWADAPDGTETAPPPRDLTPSPPPRDHTPTPTRGHTPDEEPAPAPATGWRGWLRAGDKPKSAGAAVGAGFPVLNSALVTATAPNLSSGATGMAAASSTGDAASEVMRYLQNRGFNWAKFLGGVATAGGLLTNSGAQVFKAGGDTARVGGLYAQMGGLILKGYGESTKLEDGFHFFPDGDWSKAAGAFIAAAAPALQTFAVQHQRKYEAMIAAGTHTGKIPVSNHAIAAAVLSGAAPAGDFASELVKAVRDRKVNVPKMLGGLFGAFGAVALTVGVATDNNAAKYAGYGLQIGGLGMKSWGEYSPHEDRWPRLPQKERAADEEMPMGAVRT